MLGIYRTYEFDDVWFWIGVDQSRCAKYKLFLGVFKERISDCWKQGWDDRIQEHDRYSVYRCFSNWITHLSRMLII